MSEAGSDPTFTLVNAASQGFGGSKVLLSFEHDRLGHSASQLLQVNLYSLLENNKINLQQNIHLPLWEVIFCHAKSKLYKDVNFV